jgi:hypothetical protein
VRAHQIDLQLANLWASDLDVAKLSHSGGNRVRRLVVGDKLVDNCSRPVDSFASFCEQQDGTPLDCYFPNRFQSQIVSVDVKSLQGNSRIKNSAAGRGS